MSARVETLLSGKLLARNAIWNFAGMVAPLAVAVLVLPSLIDGMGKERFGLLAIIWMGIGYFSLFDMGLGRALTRLVAENLDREDPDILNGLIWTALWLVLGLGIIAMLGLFAIGPAIVAHVFNVSQEHREEAAAAFRILAMGLPVVTSTAALVGVLEAHQRFGSIAALRTVLGSMTFLAPLMTLQITPSLAMATAALLATRVIASVFYFIAARRCRPDLLRPRMPQRIWFER
jgi:O-antigen/teichoic acid export membrane protein